MRLGGIAAYLTEINSKDELRSALDWAQEHSTPIIMIGDGSNVIWKDEGFEGLVLINKIMGFEVISEDDENIYITVGAGENWDTFIERALNTGKNGVEFLSAIPGTVGGAPVQNIGAYGHDLSEVFMSLEAYDLHEKKFVNLDRVACNFGYRTSRFKVGSDKNRFLIVSVTFHLMTLTNFKPYYHWLEEYLNARSISDPSPNDIRQAVVKIRSERLPDPSVVANNGSFFSNPIIDSSKYHDLLDEFPKLASWPSVCFWELEDGTYKVAAGALLEYLGYKDFHDSVTGMGTWRNQALVIINENAKSTADLILFKENIVNKVQETFGIALAQEPEFLP